MEENKTEENQVESAIPKTDQELRQIALDLADGKIFCNRHVPPNDSRMLLSIFMILSLMENANQWVRDAGLIYEYLSEAGPRSINGYPMFMSCRKLNIEDTKKMFEYYNEILKYREKFLGGGG